MSELSAKSRALLDAARSARPGSTARERMGVALASRVGAAVLVVPLHVPTAPTLPLPPPVAPAPLAGAVTTVVVKSVVLGVVLGSLGVGALSMRPSVPPRSPAAIHGAAPTSPSSRSRSAPESAAPSMPTRLAAPSVESAPPPSSAAAVTMTEDATRPAPEPPIHAERSAPAASLGRASRPMAAPRAVEKPDSSIGDGASEPPAPPVPTISLGDETASLRDALGSLKQGDGAEAIAKLDDMAARHPTGVLREERLAARVLALCAAGRVEEAREAGRRFLEEMPSSVQADRIRASCASSPR